jgi:two-component system NtrC family sensor kinase
VSIKDKKPEMFLRQLLPITGASVAALLILLSVFWHFESKSSEARFFELAHQRIVAVRANISIALESVNLITGHFASMPRDITSRDGFALMVKKTLELHKFVQGYSWNPLVPRARLAEYEELARKDGLAGFRIKERDPSGTLVPVAPREAYVPVYYMEPMATNMRAIGFDLASNPVRKAALDKARDTATPQATGRITLVQETGSQFGILVLSPAFAGGRTGSIEQNRSSLIGYVSGVFRLGDLIEGSGHASDKAGAPQLVDIHLYDMSADEPQQRLYPTASNATPATLTAGQYLSEEFDVAGRRWLLVATPSLWFQADHRPVASLIMFFALVVAVILLHLVLKSRIQKAEEAAAHAREMTLARERLYKAQRIARLASLEFDRERRVHATAGGISKMLGIAERLDGYPLETLLKNVAADDVERVIDNLVNCDNADGFEFEVTVDGKPRTIHARTEGENAYGRTPVTLQDITTRKQNEERTRQLERELMQSQKLEAIGTLAGGIAHEINTPIQFIGDNLAFANDAIGTLRNVLEAQRKLVGAAQGHPALAVLAAEAEASYADADCEFLLYELPVAISESRTGVNQVAGIVRAMKEFSHPANKAKASVDLNKIAERASLISKGEWKHVAELDFDLEEDLPSVMAIEGELNQVVLNLIVNAAHAVSANNHSTGRITIRTRSSDEFVELEIEDNGAGIPPAISDKIFEPFFTTKDVGKGTGQGLAIARDVIVNKHGGKIGFRDGPETGTIFSIWLPMRRVEESSPAAAA